MTDALRSTMLESLVNAATQDFRFAGDADKHVGILGPLLHGVTANLANKDYLPLSVLNLDPSNFIQSRDENRYFNNVIQGISPSEYFDVPIHGNSDHLSNLGDYLNRSHCDEKNKNRIKILNEYIKKVLEVINEDYLKLLMRVESSTKLPEAQDWLNSLNDKNDSVLETSLNKYGLRLAKLYIDFGLALLNSEVLENRREVKEKYYEPNMYDIARLFSMVIDRAITRVSWGEITNFMLKNLEMATSDMEIGQRPGLLSYLFSSRVSLLRPATHELIFQIATGCDAYKEWSIEKKRESEIQYINNRKKAFEQPGGI